MELKTSGGREINAYAQLEKDPIRQNGAVLFTECHSMAINPIRTQSCPENNIA